MKKIAASGLVLVISLLVILAPAHCISADSAALAIDTVFLPSAQVDILYNQSLEASGGTPPYTWAIATGTLPGGLLIDRSTGVISGTPSTPGLAVFTVTVADSVNSISRRTFYVTIKTDAIEPLNMSTVTPLASSDIGIAYKQSLTATGGAAPYIWSVSAGALPIGLMLDRSTGSIVGTPTSAGVASFTVTATDSADNIFNKALSITIFEAPYITAVLPLNVGEVGIEYGQTLAASGGLAPYTWAITDGTLPLGLTLDYKTGVIKGKPSMAGGPTSFDVTVRDSLGSLGNKTLAITVMMRISTTGLNSNSVARIDSSGYIHGYSQFETSDSEATLDIADMTRCLDSNGQPLANWSAMLTPSPPELPCGNSVILAYSFGPGGATFQPPLTLTLKYDTKTLPIGVSENNLCIAWWNGTAWEVYLGGIVNPVQNTISIQISHFGVLVAPVPAPTSTQSPKPSHLLPAHWQLVISGMVAIIVIISIVFLMSMRGRS